jgi:hypothetical protein
MGRLRIKKKEVVIPFRETFAYRLLLATGSVIVFLAALYVAIGALRGNVTIAFIVSAAIGVAAAFAIFYNLDRLRNVRIPKRTLQRMKRR